MSRLRGGCPGFAAFGRSRTGKRKLVIPARGLVAIMDECSPSDSAYAYLLCLIPAEALAVLSFITDDA